MLTKNAYQKCLANALRSAFGQHRTLSNLFFVFFVFFFRKSSISTLFFFKK